MGTVKMPDDQLAPSTRRCYDLLRKREPSPRVRHAIRLYETGAVPTKKAAAEAFGLSSAALYTSTMPSIHQGDTPLSRVREEIDDALYNRTVGMSRILQMISREAVGKIHDLMRNSDSEHIQLKAAVDLADRAPDTSKTQKIAAVGVTLSGKDVNDLAKVMAESAQAREDYEDIGQDDYVKATVEDETVLPHHAQRELKRAELASTTDDQQPTPSRAEIEQAADASS